MSNATDQFNSASAAAANVGQLVNNLLDASRAAIFERDASIASLNETAVAITRERDQFARDVVDLKAKLAAATAPVTPTQPTQPAVAHGFGVVGWASYKPSIFADPLKAMGFDTYRSWASVGPAPGNTSLGEIDALVAWANAGFRVVLTIAPKAGTTAVAIKAIMTAVGNRIVELRLTDKLIVVLGNEPDLGQYWPGGDFAGYLRDIYLPGATAFRAANPACKLALPPLGNQAKLAVNLPVMKAFADANLPLWDYADAHLYDVKVSGLKGKRDLVNKYFPSAKLIISEWGCFASMALGSAKPAEFKAGIADALKVIAAGCAVDCFFRLTDKGDIVGFDAFEIFKSKADAVPTEFAEPYKAAIAAAKAAR